MSNFFKTNEILNKHLISKTNNQSINEFDLNNSVVDHNFKQNDSDSKFKLIKIENGVYKGEKISSMFRTRSKSIITNNQSGNQYWKVINENNKEIFIRITDNTKIELINDNNQSIMDNNPIFNLNDRQVLANLITDNVEEPEEKVLDRIAQKFKILDKLVLGVCRNAIKSLIVSGPAGIGKTYGIEQILKKQDALGNYKYEFVKGNISPIGIYKKLWEFKSKDSILVFDDCDSVFAYPEGLNIFKAALDSSDKRFISWETETKILEKYDIPNKFEFEGSVIFITNLKFHDVKSVQLKDHLMALESRSHYLDLSIDSKRDKVLIIKQKIRDTHILKDYNFTEEMKNDIVSYIDTKTDSLRELSLRTVKKIADLASFAGDDWKELADITLNKSSLLN